MNDNAITIPPKAEEAVAVELYYAAHGNSITWEDAPSWVRDNFRRKARPACLAMLENWEGMKIHGDTYTNPPRHNIILPLTEPSDDNDLRRAAHINAKKLVPSDRAALREKVVKLYADKWGVTDAWLADAAIAVVLEEAARVADRERYNTATLTSLPPQSSAAFSIAAAIRGLITSPESAAPVADQPRAIR
jgi:hypothetical protein